MFKAKPHSENLKFLCCRRDYEPVFLCPNKTSKKATSPTTSPFPGNGRLGDILVVTTSFSHSAPRKLLRFYVITYESGTGLQHFLLALIIAGVLLACMFPVWPMWAKVPSGLRGVLGALRWRMVLGMACFLHGISIYQHRTKNKRNTTWEMWW